MLDIRLDEDAEPLENEASDNDRAPSISYSWPEKNVPGSISLTLNIGRRDYVTSYTPILEFLDVGAYWL
ncbi:hypothetical protein HY212_02625 [Candidatus Pacearchaeota archaeon]|nr:hypothetical protein [Candidatus Pacearchaeota archaeon]